MKGIHPSAARDRRIVSASVTGAENVLRYYGILASCSLALLLLSFPLLSAPVRNDILRLVDSCVTHGALLNLEFYFTYDFYSKQIFFNAKSFIFGK